LVSIVNSTKFYPFFGGKKSLNIQYHKIENKINKIKIPCFVVVQFGKTKNLHVLCFEASIEEFGFRV
jgi:hypothetical protein